MNGTKTKSGYSTSSVNSEQMVNQVKLHPLFYLTLGLKMVGSPP